MTVVVPLWVSGLGLSLLTDGRTATAGRILTVVAPGVMLLVLALGSTPGRRSAGRCRFRRLETTGGGPSDVPHMASQPNPRYGMVVACLAAALSVALISLVTPWALWVLWVLCVLPFALVIGICACRGMTATETWERMSDESGDDVGRGPAGWSPSPRQEVPLIFVSELRLSVCPVVQRGDSLRRAASATTVE